MARNTIYDQLSKWEKLLKAAREGEPELAGAAPFRAALEEAHAKAASVRQRREELRIASQEATLQMNQALEECHDAAISLLHYIKSVLGSRSEKLIRYGIPPRKGGRAPRAGLSDGGTHQPIFQNPR